MAKSNGRSKPRAEQVQPLRITRIELQNWRNFTSVAIPLQRRAFLVGPNASGKSNLLDAVRFLRDVVRVGGGFQAAVRSRDGVSSLRSFAARRQPSIRVAVDLGTDEEPKRWRYELEFDQGSNGRARPLLTRELVFRAGDERPLLERPDDDDERDPERLTQTHLEQVGTNQAFRQVAEFLGSVRYLHLVPQLVRDPDRSAGLVDDPYGGDFLEQIAATKPRQRDALLRRIVSALRSAVPQLGELVSTRDDAGRPHLEAKDVHWRPNAWQNERHLSDGTVRLVGVLYAALQEGGPLLLEEPELSLHPAVVRFVPGLLARVQQRTGQQLLVSTHSADLLLDEGIGLDEVLLFVPQREGTVVAPASKLEDAARLLEGGLTLPEIVLPRTEPENVRQLSLFDAGA